ncbi:hypothetical protein ECANGB1_974 [Enterospora canceri]|uniref:Uncharacterized protein n=1 Tax=Enterospora canceri TaxID=1081671 RepID=A0A1Y1S8A2_9MICR|nr:hypothetical protein ECANGB1_974 [Enterospora canceri]
MNKAEQLEYERRLIRKHRTEILSSGSFDCLKQYDVLYIHKVDQRLLLEELVKSKPSAHYNLKKLETKTLLSLAEEHQHLLGRIQHVASTRDGLFSDAVCFLENRRVKSELHYWIPGARTTNVFAMIGNLLPDFGDLYKVYLLKCYAFREQHRDCLRYLREKGNKVEVEEIECMVQDRGIFRNNFTITKLDYVDEIKEGAFHRAIDGYRNPGEFGEVEVENCGKLGNIVRRRNINRDLSAEMLPELSFVEYEVDGVVYVGKLSDFDQIVKY